MHEFGLALEIVDIVLDTMKKENVSVVHTVKLDVGKLMVVVPESLMFGFETACEGTPLEGAKLEINEVPVTAECNACSKRFQVEEFLFICPQCGSTHITVCSGKDIQITSLEVEKNGCYNT